MKTETSVKARHIVLRAEAGETLPDALVKALRGHNVAGGWIRGHGVLADIELRAYGSDIGGLGAGRRIAGPAQALVLDGTVGVADGDISVGLRGVFARETDRGLETVAGEIAAARVVALEVVVTAFDDVVLPRGLDPDAGVWLSKDPMPGAPPATNQPEPARTPTPRAPGPAWSEAASASASSARDKPRTPTPSPAESGLPLRPLQPVPVKSFRPDDAYDGLFPAAGDFVEHFAFGTCEVLKSDGDRLHLRVGKDGRVREIALEMLRVTLLTSDGETQRYRLDRKL